MSEYEVIILRFVARLIHKGTGVMYSAEFDAVAGPDQAAKAALERFGRTHRVVTIYPLHHHSRLVFDINRAKAALERR